MNMDFKSSWFEQSCSVYWLSHGSEKEFQTCSLCDLGLGNGMRNQLSKCGLFQ